jgi:hypothetical protein
MRLRDTPLKARTVFALVSSILLTGVGPDPTRPSAVIHHQVSTNVAAQAAFDQGLLDYYAYNPEAAEHQFYTAADLDNHLAMAYWGIALSNAPNLNVDATDDRNTQARVAIRRAVALEQYATPEDRAFIDAASARFDASSTAKPLALLSAYRDSLDKIASANPDDPDAAALYMEAALYVVVDNGNGRGYDRMSTAQRTAYRADFTQLLPQFQAYLTTFPKHVGLIHFYIHAAQLAGNSAAAVNAARQLASFGFLPQDSHLTHMAGHTFFDVGLYDEALDVGTRSVAMDFAEIDCCHPGYYSANRYYHNHNVNFELYAMVQTGHIAEAVAVAERENNVDMMAKQYLAAERWQDIVALPQTSASDPVLTFARGIAYAKLGDVDQAQAALGGISLSPNASPYQSALITTMRSTLDGEIAIARHDNVLAMSKLSDASQTAAALNDGAEFPALYYFSPHMALANLATALGQVDVARAALQAELVASPRSPKAEQALGALDGTTSR